MSAGIFNLGWGRFPGYTTDVGYIDGSGNAPISVNRGPGGAGIGFRFASPDSPDTAIGPGGSSAILVVATDATTYDNLGALGVSGGRASSPANGQITGLFEPTFRSEAPEPATTLLLSLGLLAIAAMCWKIRLGRAPQRP